MRPTSLERSRLTGKRPRRACRCLSLALILPLGATTVIWCPSAAWAQSKASHAEGSSPDTAKERDGQHDFDWDIGTWKTHQKRLLHPLTGSATWVEYHGTDAVSRIWDGANMGQIEADGPAGHLQLFTLRLYDPDTHEWKIYFLSGGGGTLSSPVVGRFTNGRGEFIDQEPYHGKSILVRFSVSDIGVNSCHFEQAFSADGGRTWETNFIVDETRMSGKTPAAQ